MIHEITRKMGNEKSPMTNGHPPKLEIHAGLVSSLLNEGLVDELQLLSGKVFMDVQALFGISILISFVAFGLVTKFYIWPRLQGMDRDRALLALIVPHTFRFIGLSFLVPGVVSSSLPPAFATPAAYGDLVAAILAIVGFVALYKRWPLSILLVWIFNIWGAADFLLAFYNGFMVNLDPSTLGAAFYIPTGLVPPLLITHGLIFWLLVRRRG